MPILPGLVLGLLGCGDPVAEAVASYHERMAPLMVQNTALANRYLALAKAVHKDGTPSDEVARQISTEVVPAAVTLRDAIAAVQPTLEDLASVHAQAVQGWTLQAEAYQAMTAAYEANDLAAFTAAQGRLTEAKVAIDAWEKEANRRLEPYGYHVDEFPQAR